MPAGVTLLEMATDLRATLGYSLNISHGIDQQPALYAALRRTQIELWRMHDWPEHYIELDTPVPALTQIIAVPTGLDFQMLNDVWWRPTGERRRRLLDYGIWADQRSRKDFTHNGDTGSPVERYAFNASTSGQPTDMLELWPVPDIAGILTCGGRIALLDLVAESDVCTLDSELIIAQAATPIMLRNKDPTAQIQATKGMALFNRLRARQGALKRKPFLIHSRI
jgi:hypothetical protein